MKIKISIITSLYSVKFIYFEKTYNSVINDSYFHFCEWIIIDDTLNDINLLNFLQKNDRVVILKNNENIGLTKSLNNALDIARGEVIVRVDHDDYFLINRLEKISNFFNENKRAVLRCSGYKVEINGKIKLYSGVTRELKLKDFIFTNPVLHSSVAFRKVINGVSVSYNSNLKYSQDFDLWMHLLGVNGLFYISDMEVYRTVLSNGISLSNRAFLQSFTGLKIRFHFFLKHKKIYLLPLAIFAYVYQLLIVFIINIKKEI